MWIVVTKNWRYVKSFLSCKAYFDFESNHTILDENINRNFTVHENLGRTEWGLQQFIYFAFVNVLFLPHTHADTNTYTYNMHAHFVHVLLQHAYALRSHATKSHIPQHKVTKLPGLRRYHTEATCYCNKTCLMISTHVGQYFYYSSF